MIANLAQMSLQEETVAVSKTAQDDLASSIESVLPIETLQLWTIAQQPVNMLSYVPKHCNKHQKVLL